MRMGGEPVRPKRRSLWGDPAGGWCTLRPWDPRGVGCQMTLDLCPGALFWIVSRVDTVDETQGADMFNSVLLCDDMNSC